MIPQTFSPSDIPAVLLLVGLEGLLSADNALVLAIMVRHLPKALQQKALLYGLVGAFVFRLIAVLFAAVVLKQWWLQAIGAMYLLYLPLKHFAHSSKDGAEAAARRRGGGFWQTVIAVEITDIAFALDSVLAGVGFIIKPGIGMQMDKVWVVYTGAIIGIVLLRFAAGAFVKLLVRYPVLDNVAYLLVGWVGFKLAAHSLEKFGEANPGVLPFGVPHLPEAVFWGGLLAIIAVGTFVAIRNPASPSEEDLAAGEVEVHDVDAASDPSGPQVDGRSG